MTKTLLILAAASTLTLSCAGAQSPAQMPSAPPGPSSRAASDVTGDRSAANTAITAQTPDQWLATKFKGTQVVGADDAKIGNVEDILFDRTGTVKAVVVGVGGFLGIGSKQVAFPLPALQVIAGKDGAPDQLRLSMTKEQLASAPEFKPYEPPRAAANAPPRPSTSGLGINPMSTPPTRQQ